jgi:hypothetical protein
MILLRSEINIARYSSFYLNRERSRRKLRSGAAKKAPSLITETLDPNHRTHSTQVKTIFLDILA